MSQQFGWQPHAQYCGWINHPEGVAWQLRQMPYPYFESAAANLMGSGADTDILLYKAWKDVLGKYPEYPAQEIGDCFVAGTMVVGEQIKPIEDVQIGDRVWTAEGELTTVVSKRAIKTMRPLVEIRPVGGLPIQCTADHKWLVYRFAMVGDKRVTPSLYQRASEAKANGANSRRVSFAIEQFEGRQPEWVAAGELCDTDCILTPASFEGIDWPNSPGDLLSSEGGRFALGYFLGNGHASGGSAEWTMPLGSPVTTKLVAALEAHGFNPKINRYKGKKAERVRVHSRELVGWLRDFFYVGDTKSYPGCLIGDSAFFEGLYAADGSTLRKKREISSTSRSIIYGAYSTLVAMGHEPSVTNYSRSKGTYANAKPLYRLYWTPDRARGHIWRDDQFVCRPVRSVKFIEGPTTVYDIGVASGHHSFLANGYAVHNCTSFGSAHVVDLTECIQIALENTSEAYKETCTEALYGAGREIANMLGSGDGCYGAALARAVTEVGVVPRELVGAYSGQRAKQWGNSGVPADIKSKMAEHKIGTASMVKTLDELDAGLANGYVCTVCSNQGFTLERDQDGFCRAEGSWPHCMMIAAKRVTGRKGYLICQSWGAKMPSGPTALDQPSFSFWVEPQTIASMLQMQDSFFFSKFQGYPGQPLPSHWTYATAA